MRPSDAEIRIKAIVVELDSAACLARMREYEKSGYPGASMSDGRGGEPPCPVVEHPKTGELVPTDRTDREIRADRITFEQALRFMVTAGDTTLGICHKYLNARTTDSDKATKLAPPPGSGPCGNVFCDHTCSGVGNDRLRKAPKRTGDDPAKATVARCQPCDQFWRRNGVERDPRERVLQKVTKP